MSSQYFWPKSLYWCSFKIPDSVQSCKGNIGIGAIVLAIGGLGVGVVIAGGGLAVGGIAIGLIVVIGLVVVIGFAVVIGVVVGDVGLNGLAT